MKTNRGKFVEWFGLQVSKTVEALTYAIWRDGDPDLAGVPAPVHQALHRIALMNLLATVCYPRDALEGVADPEACAMAYEDFVKSQNHLLIQYCEALAAWRPDKQRRRNSRRNGRSVNRRVVVMDPLATVGRDVSRAKLN